ncbi:hypothetical protein N9C31_01500 [Gammaproteobacteria bacterium]|nr:hypothetical protein [Gammaproteobacteria bacterium]
MKNAVIFSGACLIAGTTIGATVLVLVGAVIGYGFGQVMGLYFSAWLLMTVTGLMLAEVCIKMPAGHSFLSLIGHYWGDIGKWIFSVIFYLLMFFLLCSYLKVLGALSHGSFGKMGFNFSEDKWLMIWLCLLSIVMVMGRHFLQDLNAAFVVMMVIGFVIVYLTILPHCHFENLLLLEGRHSLEIEGSTSLLFLINAFGFHIIIPTVRNSLGQNELKKVYSMIWLGTLIPVVLYVLWYVVSIALLPIDFLNSINADQIPMEKWGLFVTDIIQQASQSHVIYFSLILLHFMFVLTSIIGISMALYDLISDFFQIQGYKQQHIVIVCLSILPSTVFIYFVAKDIRAFLAYAGKLVILLNVILPALLLAQERYIRPQLKRYAGIPTGLTYLVVLIGGALLYFQSS